MPWTVPADALGCAKDAHHALLGVCVTDQATIAIHGEAGDNETTFVQGDPIVVAGLSFWAAMDRITAWFERGRTITRIELYNH